MVAKSVDEDQNIWYSHLPNVLLASISSVLETTGFRPHLLVIGHELSHSLDWVFQIPLNAKRCEKLDLTKEEAFGKTYELVRRSSNAQQLRHNSLCNKRVYGPT